MKVASVGQDREVDSQCTVDALQHLLLRGHTRA